MSSAETQLVAPGARGLASAPGTNSPRQCPALRSLVLVLLALLGWAAGGARSSAAEPPRIDEYQLKAAFLPKFPLFVHWPATNALAESTELIIGVLGKNPFGAHLENACHGKMVERRALLVRPCQNVAEAARCHLVFIAAPEPARLPELLAALTAAGVLTISDAPGFAAAGGMIGMVVGARKIRLEINLQAVRQPGLRVAPQLLQMARVIRAPTAAPPGPR